MRGFGFNQGSLVALRTPLPQFQFLAPQQRVRVLAQDANAWQNLGPQHVFNWPSYRFLVPPLRFANLSAARWALPACGKPPRARGGLTFVVSAGTFPAVLQFDRRVPWEIGPRTAANGRSITAGTAPET